MSKIINLQADNVLKLTAIDITPNANMVMITGKNGAGKTAVLDSITMLLCGGKKIPGMPIKKGATKGRIKASIGEGPGKIEFYVTRSLTKEGSYLKIEKIDGEIIKSPQSFLDKIVGNISFDPVEFLDYDDKKQRDTLLKLIGVDVASFDAKDKTLRDQRLLVGRRRDEKEALLKTANPYAEVAETEEQSVSDLANKLREALDFNSAIDSEIQANENMKVLAKKDLEVVDALATQIKDLQAQLVELTTKQANLAASVETKKALYLSTRKELEERSKKDVTGAQTQLNEIEALNIKIRGKKTWYALRSDIATLNTEYDGYSKSISDIQTDRSKLLAKAKIPVKGLSFDDNGLLYNDIPLIQASSGERIKVALGISMALNPILRVIRVKDGSLLDEINRAIIDMECKEKDYQLWFESVGADSKVGILIEEGQIAKVDGVPQEMRQDEPTTGTATSSADGTHSSISAVGAAGDDPWPDIPDPTKPVAPVAPLVPPTEPPPVTDLSVKYDADGKVIVDW
jgi:hypothetical protein